MMMWGGAAMDNAKKYVEMGHFGGKNTETHAATVVGDTVGDPWKDTAGPSLHILIKLLNTISLVFIPLFFAAIILLYSDRSWRIMRSTAKITHLRAILSNDEYASTAFSLG